MATTEAFKAETEFVRDKTTSSRKLGNCYWEYENTASFNKELNDFQIKVYLKMNETEQSLAKETSRVIKDGNTKLKYKYTVDSSG